MASTVALTPREAEALCASNYPCPPGYCVPVGWMLSVGGVPVPPVPLGVARRMAITNHYYFELTPEQRRNPRWHPDYFPTWEAFFVDRRERALASPRATLKYSPRVLSRGSITATPTTTAMTAAARTTTTVASITGVGRSMTESLQHSETSSADCYLIWPCILIFSSFMYLNFQFQFGRLLLNLAMYLNFHSRFLGFRVK